MYNKHDTSHIQNRITAQEQGNKTYYGPPCKYQHDGRRYTGNGSCVICTRIKSRDKYRSKIVKPTQARPDPVYSMYHSAKHRAAKRKRDFTISMSDIIIPETCPVLGIPMDSPSIDRWNNDKGYTKDNIRIISRRANVLKSDATIEELEKILDYMKNPA